MDYYFVKKLIPSLMNCSGVFVINGVAVWVRDSFGRSGLLRSITTIYESTLAWHHIY